MRSKPGLTVPVNIRPSPCSCPCPCPWLIALVICVLAPAAVFLAGPTFGQTSSARSAQADTGGDVAAKGGNAGSHAGQSNGPGKKVLVAQSQDSNKSGDGDKGSGADTGADADDQNAAVVVGGKRLYVFNGVRDGFSAKERAQRATDAIIELSNEKSFDPSLVELKESADGTEVVYRDTFIATMTLDDAKRAQSSTQILASEFAAKLRIALNRQFKPVTPYSIAFGVGTTVGASVLMLIIAGILGRLSGYARSKIDKWNGTVISGVHIQKAELLSASSLCNIFHTLNKIAEMATFLAALYIYLIVVLSSFPGTQWLALALRDTALVPMTTAVEALVGYLPKAMAVLAIAILTYAVIAFADFFFNAIQIEQISFSGFDPEWAEPTFQLVRVMIIAFALVASLPYAPFGESESFKQVGLLFSILVSLGSTSVIGNVMAGTVLTYSNAFKIGDRIKIGDCIGDVQEKSLFVTRIRTTKNEIVSIPNGQILNTNITNFSAMGKAGQLIVHTEVTIGYGEPWRRIHELLTDAALASEGIVPEPKPFVLQTALTDFSVCYQLNAYCNTPNNLNQVHSQLHRNIQDRFHTAGVEITSGHYTYLRDGNQSTIPAEHLPKGYVAPTFVVTSSKSS
jgi:small-conductance mechanosensitive channel